MTDWIMEIGRVILLLWVLWIGMLIEGKWQYFRKKGWFDEKKEGEDK